jgi:putative membrane protein insertion efficiency factor
MTVGRRAGLLIIRAYQLVLSPFAGGACRFEPSCSEYAAEAVHRHGLARGGWLALRRVARCHPFARPGFDPVPPSPAEAEGRV